MSVTSLLAGALLVALGTVSTLGAADRLEEFFAQPGYLKAEFVSDPPPTVSIHASTIVESDGVLMAAWFGGTHEKHADVGIFLSRRGAGGWGVPVQVADGFDAEGKRHPCWNPVLFRPKNGPLMLFYKVGPSPSTWWGMLKTSLDNGRTWGGAKRLPDGIMGPVRNKPVAWGDGGILCGSSTEDQGWRVQMEYTPDEGKTWERTEALNKADQFGAIQPTILHWPSGKVQILNRSRQRVITSCWMGADWKSWGPMEATSLPNPNSGIDAVMLRDGRALLVYNHSASQRTPAHVAVSRDGVAWEAALTLEDAGGELSYPAVIQTADGLVHITYTWKRKRVRHIVVDPAKFSTRPIRDGRWPE